MSDRVYLLGLRHFLRLLAVVGCGLASTANAEILQLGATSQYVYNSNFFSNAGNANDANSFQIGPNIAIVDPDGRFRYDLTYTGAYQAYVDQSGVNAWESRLRVRATYDIDRRTVIRLTNRFRDVSNLRFSRQDIALLDTALDPNQDRYLRNDLELEVIRDLSRNLALNLRIGHHWIDFDKNIDRNDSQSVDVGSELDFQVADEHVVGVGVTYTYQDFESALSRLGSRADYVNAYLTWSWQLADRIQFTMNGGPSWIRSREDDPNRVSEKQFVGGRVNGDVFRADILSCAPQNIASDCDFATGVPVAANNLGPVQNFALAIGPRVGEASELTFFGGASITASFAEWNFQTSYSRRQSTTSGDGLASSLDRVAVNVELAPPTSRWSTFVAGSWDRRETLTDATFVDYTVISATGTPGEAAERSVAFTTVEDSRSRRDNFTAIVGARNALDRNWSGTLEFRYRRTQARDRGISRPDVDTYLVLFTVEYAYDPIEF